MTMPLLIRENRGPVAILTLNRPERRNALSKELLARLRDALDELGIDTTIRSIVLTGSGISFCTGMDLKEAAVMDAAPDGEQEMVDVLKEFADLLHRLHTLPRPIVAAVNGDALAGGAGLMAACDLVVACESARIGYPEVRRGLVASIVMPDLVRQIGDRRARQLLLTGEPISASQALHWGLVNAVRQSDACLAEAVRLASEMVLCGPSALSNTKRILLEVENWPKDLRGAAAVSAVIRSSEEAREGIAAFVEKRPPLWKIQ